MDLKLALERDGKMLKKTGFKKCGHRICMIKDPTECGICGKRYTKGTNKYYTSEFMDQIDEIVRKICQIAIGTFTQQEKNPLLLSRRQH